MSVPEGHDEESQEAKDIIVHPINCINGAYESDEGFTSKEEEDDDEICDIATISKDSAVFPKNTAFNLEHCSDVTIGPVTQIHGPVTIYQNVNGTQRLTNGECKQSDLNESATDQESNSSERPTKSKKNIKLCNKRTLIISLVLLTTILILSILLPLVLQGESSTESIVVVETSDPPLLNETTTTETNESLILLPNTPRYIYRNIWNGRPPLNFTVPLKHPVDLVIITQTDTYPCNDFLTCVAKVINLQSSHVGTMGLPDIGFNFLIGGDNDIYVGTGWNTTSFHSNDSIDIAFIGNYNFDTLTEEMATAAQKVLADGVKEHFLTNNYTLVCYNQTADVNVPGPNVYKVVKNWPHFRPGKLPRERS